MPLDNKPEDSHIHKPLTRKVSDFVWKRYFLKPIYESVPQYGGTVNEEFSQVMWEFAQFFSQDPEVKGGICVGLSGCWVRAQVQEKNLFDRLYPHREGTQKGQPDAQRIVSFIQLQKEGQGKNRRQDITTRWWLSKNGVKYEPLMNQKGGTGSMSLVDAILDTGRQKSAYKLIDIEPTLGPAGHQFAAYIDSETVKFFEPNFGEFEFSGKNSHHDFRRWFTEKFWTLSWYHLFFKDNTYTVDAFQPAHAINQPLDTDQLAQQNNRNPINRLNTDQAESTSTTLKSDSHESNAASEVMNADAGKLLKIKSIVEHFFETNASIHKQIKTVYDDFIEEINKLNRSTKVLTTDNIERLWTKLKTLEAHTATRLLDDESIQLMKDFTLDFLKQLEKKLENKINNLLSTETRETIKTDKRYKQFIASIKKASKRLEKPDNFYPNIFNELRDELKIISKLSQLKALLRDNIKLTHSFYDTGLVDKSSKWRTEWLRSLSDTLEEIENKTKSISITTIDEYNKLKEQVVKELNKAAPNPENIKNIIEMFPEINKAIYDAFIKNLECVETKRNKKEFSRKKDQLNFIKEKLTLIIKDLTLYAAGHEQSLDALHDLSVSLKTDKLAFQTIKKNIEKLLDVIKSDSTYFDDHGFIDKFYRVGVHRHEDKVTSLSTPTTQQKRKKHKLIIQMGNSEAETAAARRLMEKADKNRRWIKQVGEEWVEVSIGADGQLKSTPFSADQKFTRIMIVGEGKPLADGSAKDSRIIGSHRGEEIIAIIKQFAAREVQRINFIACFPKKAFVEGILQRLSISAPSSPKITVQSATFYEDQRVGITVDGHRYLPSPTPTKTMLWLNEQSGQYEEIITNKPPRPKEAGTIYLGASRRGHRAQANRLAPPTHNVSQKAVSGSLLSHDGSRTQGATPHRGVMGTSRLMQAYFFLRSWRDAEHLMSVGQDQMAIEAMIGGLAVPLAEEGAEQGYQKLIHYLQQKKGGTFLPHRQSAGWMSQRLVRIGRPSLLRGGGALIGSLSTAWDIYSAVKGFNEASRLEGFAKTATLVNASLNVVSAFVSTATVALILISGGKAVSKAGPIGLGVGLVLLVIGGSIDAARIVRELQDAGVNLSTADKVEIVFRTFVGMGVPQHLEESKWAADLMKASLDQHNAHYTKLIEQRPDVKVVYLPPDIAHAHVRPYAKRMIDRTQLQAFRQEAESKYPYAGIEGYYHAETGAWIANPEYEHHEALKNKYVSERIDQQAQNEPGADLEHDHLHLATRYDEVRHSAYISRWGSTQNRPELGQYKEVYYAYRPFYFDLSAPDLGLPNRQPGVVFAPNWHEKAGRSVLIVMPFGDHRLTGASDVPNRFEMGYGQQTVNGGDKDDWFILNATPSIETDHFKPANLLDHGLAQRQQKANIARHRYTIDGRGRDQTGNTLSLWTDFTGSPYQGYEIDLAQERMAVIGQNGERHALGTIRHIHHVDQESDTEGTQTRVRASQHRFYGDEQNNLLVLRSRDQAWARGGQDTLQLRDQAHADGGVGVDRYYVQMTDVHTNLVIDDSYANETLPGQVESSIIYLSVRFNEIERWSIENSALVLHTNNHKGQLSFKLKPDFLYGDVRWVTSDGLMLIPKQLSLSSSNETIQFYVLYRQALDWQRIQSKKGVKIDMEQQQIHRPDASVVEITSPYYDLSVQEDSDGDDWIKLGPPSAAGPATFTSLAGHDQVDAQQGREFTLLVGSGRGEITLRLADTLPPQKADRALINTAPQTESHLVFPDLVERKALNVRLIGDDVLIERGGLHDTQGAYSKTVRLVGAAKNEKTPIALNFALPNQRGQRLRWRFNEQQQPVYTLEMSGAKDTDNHFSLEPIETIIHSGQHHNSYHITPQQTQHYTLNPQPRSNHQLLIHSAEPITFRSHRLNENDLVLQCWKTSTPDQITRLFIMGYFAHPTPLTIKRVGHHNDYSDALSHEAVRSRTHNLRSSITLDKTATPEQIEVALSTGGEEWELPSLDLQRSTGAWQLPMALSGIDTLALSPDRSELLINIYRPTAKQPSHIAFKLSPAQPTLTLQDRNGVNLKISIDSSGVIHTEQTSTATGGTLESVGGVAQQRLIGSAADESFNVWHPNSQVVLGGGQDKINFLYNQQGNFFIDNQAASQATIVWEHHSPRQSLGLYGYRYDHRVLLVIYQAAKNRPTDDRALIEIHGNTRSFTLKTKQGQGSYHDLALDQPDWARQLANLPELTFDDYQYIKRGGFIPQSAVAFIPGNVIVKTEAAGQTLYGDQGDDTLIAQHHDTTFKPAAGHNQLFIGQAGHYKIELDPAHTMDHSIGIKTDPNRRFMLHRLDQNTLLISTEPDTPEPLGLTITGLHPQTPAVRLFLTDGQHSQVMQIGNFSTLAPVNPDQGQRCISAAQPCHMLIQAMAAQQLPSQAASAKLFQYLAQLPPPPSLAAHVS